MQTMLRPSPQQSTTEQRGWRRSDSSEGEEEQGPGHSPRTALEGGSDPDYDTASESDWVSAGAA